MRNLEEKNKNSSLPIFTQTQTWLASAESEHDCQFLNVTNWVMKTSSDKLKVDGWNGIRLAPQVNSSNFKISRQKLKVLNPNIFVVKGLHREIRHLLTLLAFGKCLIAEFCFKQTTTQQKWAKLNWDRGGVSADVYTNICNNGKF